MYQSIKKYVSVSLVCAMLSVVVGVANADRATVYAPKDTSGRPAHPGYAGYKHFFKSTAGEAMVCTGRCLLAGVYMNSGAASSAVVLRDTGTTDGTATAQMFPNLSYQGATDSFGNRLDRAIRSTNGISVEIDAVANGEQVTLLWVQLDGE